MHGCNGKMGKMISQIIAKDERLEMVAGVDRFDDGSNPFPVFEDIRKVDIACDVIIDFSNAEAVEDLLAVCVAKTLPLVLCTTGLSEEVLHCVNKASTQIAILRSANMSLGINLLIKLLADAAKVLAPAGYDVELVERHHNQKLDAPSGTALALADSVNDALGGDYQYIYDRTQVRQKRGEKEIGMAVVRGGTIVGEHEVIFAGEDEVIEFKHTAYSRSVFAKGAIEAALFLTKQAPGLYDMSNVING